MSDIDDKEAANIAAFKEWLISNGAKFDKIEWPTSDTPSGVRGAIALEDIQTNETMLSIPSSLMVTPVHAFADPVIGHALRNSKDILRGDLLLTMYLSYELSKGEESFYYPFFQILPQPANISTWVQSELNELQDDKLVQRADNKKNQLMKVYDGVVHVMGERYPDLFPRELFTYDRFEFAFDTIQARAFGRRLPWTALVPFADCLNHTNVQTKYDFDVDDNGTFRLFPTGNNSYGRGCEVFNSYGRRPNHNLLLDYGFAMLDNEWDSVDIYWKIPLEDFLIDPKLRLCRQNGYGYVRKVSLQLSAIPLEVFTYFRIASLTDHEISYVNFMNKFPEGMDILDKPISLASEIRAMELLHEVLQSSLQSYPTTEERDLQILEDLKSQGGEPSKSPFDVDWKLTCCLFYRITRKRILSRNIEALAMVIDWMKFWMSAEGSLADRPHTEVAAIMDNKLTTLRAVYKTDALEQEALIRMYFWHLQDCVVDSSELQLKRVENEDRLDGVVFEDTLEEPLANSTT